jgi:hypothetical protein
MKNTLAPAIELLVLPLLYGTFWSIWSQLTGKTEIWLIGILV